MAKQAVRLVKNKFFVANLHWSCSEGVLRTYFEQFGPVTHAGIAFDMKTGMSKCFGIVCMRNEADFEKALSEKRHIIEGTQVFVKQYSIDSKRTKRKKKKMMEEDELGTPVDADGFTPSSSPAGDVVTDNDYCRDIDTRRTTESGKESSV